jgi:hypothetical protein
MLKSLDLDYIGLPCVVLNEPEDVENPDGVIAFAREIGAECDWECEPDEKPDLVVDFQIGVRQIGPELYTEEALRSTLAALHSFAKG